MAWRQRKDGAAERGAEVEPNTVAVTLEDAARLLDRPIERDGDGREVVVRDNGNDSQIELRRSHVFDPRGVRIELFGPGDRKPRMTTHIFPMARFRKVMNWFFFLCHKADSLEAEGKSERLARKYNEALVDWEAHRLP